MPPSRKNTKGDSRRKKGNYPVEPIDGAISITVSDFSSFLPELALIRARAAAQFGAEFKSVCELVIARKATLKKLAAEAETTVPKTPKPRLGALASIARTIHLFDELLIKDDSNLSDDEHVTDHDQAKRAPVSLFPESEVETSENPSSPVPEVEAPVVNEDIIDNPVIKEEPISPPSTRSQSRQKLVKPKEEPVSPTTASPKKTRTLRVKKASKTPATVAREEPEERASAGRNERAVRVPELARALSPHKHIVNTPTKPERREQVQRIITTQDRLRNRTAAPVAEPKQIRTYIARPHEVNKLQDLDQKLQQQQRRVEIAQQNKNNRVKEQSERIKRANEEKILRVQRNREEQEAKERERMEKKRQKDEERERILKSKIKSPARTNPSSRVASPSRVPRPAVFTPKACHPQLFADTPSSNRTPGRAASKASKLMHAGGETAKGEYFASPAREVKRKIVSKIERRSNSNENKPQKPAIAQSVDHESQMRMLLEEQSRRMERDAALRRAEAEEEERREIEQERLIQERREAKLKEEEFQRQEAERAEKRRRDEEKLRREVEEERRRQVEEEQRRRQAEEEKERKRREQELLKKKQQEEAQKLEELRKKEEKQRRLLKEQEKENRCLETPKPKNKLLPNSDMYEMTPDKVFLPSSKDNYNIEDLSSGDETDCEDEPRKAVPEWASWSSLKKIGVEQFDPTLDRTVMFGFMPAPEIELVFGKMERKKSRRRASSGKWNSPASNPTKGTSRFLGF